MPRNPYYSGSIASSMNVNPLPAGGGYGAGDGFANLAATLAERLFYNPENDPKAQQARLYKQQTENEAAKGSRDAATFERSNAARTKTSAILDSMGRKIVQYYGPESPQGRAVLNGEPMPPEEIAPAQALPDGSSQVDEIVVSPAEKPRAPTAMTPIMQALAPDIAALSTAMNEGDYDKDDIERMQQSQALLFGMAGPAGDDFISRRNSYASQGANYLGKDEAVSQSKQDENVERNRGFDVDDRDAKFGQETKIHGMDNAADIRQSSISAGATIGAARINNAGAMSRLQYEVANPKSTPRAPVSAKEIGGLVPPGLDPETGSQVIRRATQLNNQGMDPGQAVDQALSELTEVKPRSKILGMFGSDTPKRTPRATPAAPAGGATKVIQFDAQGNPL